MTSHVEVLPYDNGERYTVGGKRVAKMRQLMHARERGKLEKVFGVPPTG